MRWVGPTGPSSTPTTTCGTTPRPCSPRWRSRPGTPLTSAPRATAIQEFLAFLKRVARAYRAGSCT
jgi:hypothetical protein